MDLRVVVGSTNPVKINSTRQCFESVFGSKVRTITVTGIKSQSEVSVRRFYVFYAFFTFFTYKSTISSSCVCLRWKNRRRRRHAESCIFFVFSCSPLDAFSKVHRFYVFTRFLHVLPIKVRYRPRLCVWDEKTEEKKEKTCCESCIFLYFRALESSREFLRFYAFFTRFFTYKSTIPSSCMSLCVFEMKKHERRRRRHAESCFFCIFVLESFYLFTRFFYVFYL